MEYKKLPSNKDIYEDFQDGIKSKKHPNLKKFFYVTILILLLVSNSAVGYLYYTTRNDLITKKLELEALRISQDKINSLINKENASSKTPTATNLSKQLSKEEQTTCTGLTVNSKENIIAAITSKNTAALEGKMAKEVSVVIAASSYGKKVDAAQAVKDLDYLNSGTEPWDFKLSAAVLDSYLKGSYKEYFSETSLTGKSNNKYIVSFDFDCDAKISKIFMASNEELLINN